MNKLGELYSNFSRIDLDTRGGYARVAEVKTHGRTDIPEFCAFKLMRHENEESLGVGRFEEELNLLVKITNDPTAPAVITKIYDSGFAPIEVSQSLQNREAPNPELEIISTGTEIKEFQKQKSKLQKKDPGRWLPFLTVELAPYDDSLFRQIKNQPQNDPLGLFRLPTGEVIAMSLQLLETMQYLHTNHDRAYMDWKPEHIFWSGMNKQIKLIDWNVTTPLEDGPGKKQNIRDDLRLFCGAVLYIGLTFIDPDDPTKSIGPRPTKELATPVPEIRRRYWTDNPNFHQRDIMLDEKIKGIIRQGLDPQQGFDSIQTLRTALIEYTKEELGITEPELTLQAEPNSPYFKALVEVRDAQNKLIEAQQNLVEAVKQNGSKLEYTRLYDAIKHSLVNFPIS
jgi:serine/threonine protein kinase